MRIKNALERIAAYTEPEPNSGCWLWTAATANGYGRMSIGNQRTSMAHRAVYELLTGDKIPAGYDIDHLCRNRQCVNPKHLEPVTRRENLRRSPLIMALACPSGHAYDMVLPNGWRRCRVCDLSKRNNRRRARIAAGLPRGS